MQRARSQYPLPPLMRGHQVWAATQVPDGECPDHQTVETGKGSATRHMQRGRGRQGGILKMMQGPDPERTLNQQGAWTRWNLRNTLLPRPGLVVSTLETLTHWILPTALALGVLIPLSTDEQPEAQRG